MPATTKAPTTALDFATIAYALHKLESKLGDCEWTAAGPGLNRERQETLLDWYCDNRNAVAEIDSQQLTARASGNHETLNAFLASHGFPPQFQPLNGIGVASVLDLRVTWPKAAEKAAITVESQEFPAFTLGSHVTLYRVNIGESWYQAPLIRLQDANGLSLWVMTTNAPSSPLALTQIASKLLASQRTETGEFGDHVTLPMLSINQEADLSWMIDMRSEDGDFAVAQAFQQFKLNVNHVGATAKVGTGLVNRGACLPPAHVMDRPFMGFFTLPAQASKPGVELIPLAPFYASFDCWKEPLAL